MLFWMLDSGSLAFAALLFYFIIIIYFCLGGGGRVAAHTFVSNILVWLSVCVRFKCFFSACRRARMMELRSSLGA